MTYFTNLKAHLSGLGGSFEDLNVLEFTDTAAIGGVQQCSIVLPGLHVQQGNVRSPLIEKLKLGDDALIEGSAWDGRNGSERTLMDGLITSISSGETFAQGAFQVSTTINIQSMPYVLTSDQVSYFIYYGGKEGFLKAQNELNHTNTSGRMDKILANFMNKVVFKFGQWQRDGQRLEDRIGYHFRSLPSNMPVTFNLALQEGSPWGIMQQHIDSPLHEFFSVTLPKGQSPQGGFAHQPVPTRGLGGSSWVILRPTPFPYASPDGKGQLDEWHRLKLHDFTAGALYTPLDGVQLSTAIDPVKNYFMMYPNFNPLNEEAAFSLHIAVHNPAAIKRYSLRPLIARTRFILNDKKKQNVVDFARELTWRVAGQWNRQDDMYEGSFTVPFNPDVQPGERFVVQVPLGDRTQIMQGYIMSRTHRWNRVTGGTTSIQFDRLLPTEIYDSRPQWFVEGLEEFDTDAANKLSNSKKDA